MEYVKDTDSRMLADVFPELVEIAAPHRFENGTCGAFSASKK